MGSNLSSTILKSSLNPLECFLKCLTSGIGSSSPMILGTAFGGLVTILSLGPSSPPSWAILRLGVLRVQLPIS